MAVMADMGRVIGNKGRHVQSIKGISAAASVKAGKRMAIDVVV
jgi:predicted RNA-binding protein YlqC (UPF0109 family)